DYYCAIWNSSAWIF
nr:immunoglobulin light chain junction region [Macaca mulatta]